MWIGSDNERQFLEITDPMGQSNSDFFADIVCTFNEAIVRHVAAKEDQLANSVWIDTLFDISIQYFVVIKALWRSYVMPTLLPVELQLHMAISTMRHSQASSEGSIGCGHGRSK
jgi:hypothetical protein